MEAYTEGGQGPEGNVVPWVDGWIARKSFQMLKEKHFQKDNKAMSTQQPSQICRPAKKLQTHLGKKYSFSAKLDLRETRQFWRRGLQM